MPFDSHEYVVHFRLIQPVGGGGGGGGGGGVCCPLWRGSTRGGGWGWRWGGAGAVPFRPIQSVGGGAGAVPF